MSETLYRKYRPKNFSEIIGQQHVVRTLSNAITSGRVGHAYLFTGPRGTGKTSIARILAKTINCLKLEGAISCGVCDACSLISSNRSLDIIEIDAASNTGVDNIRELRETVALPPTSLKYKIYIIDEVHMLSTGAFNALLKTLEEPPAHVIFILATTEIHKVPDTIISRTQRFDFARLPIGSMMERLSLIAKKEKVKIDKESLEMIAISAEGGMRDAESLLGQIIALEDKNITTKEVEEILGTTSGATISQVAGMIMRDDSTSAIRTVNQLLEDGYDLEVFGKSLLNYMRQVMLLKINESLREYLSHELTQEQIEEIIELSKAVELAKIISTINLLLEAQNKLGSFILPQLPLEIAIIKATHTFPKESIKCQVPSAKSSTSLNTPLKKEGSDLSLESNSKIKSQNAKLQSKDQNYQGNINNNVKLVPPEDKTPGENETDTTSANLDLDTVRNHWPKLLINIRPYNHSLSALLSNCQVTEASGKEITIATAYEFYKERLDVHSNKLTIEEIFSKILGLKVFIKIALDRSLAKKSEDASSPAEDNSGEPASSAGGQNSLLDSAMEIMGGKVVER